MLAGVPVSAPLVLELAARVDDPARTTLLDALDASRTAVALTTEEREQILLALVDCPDGLGELRGGTRSGERVARARRTRLGEVALSGP